MGFNQTVFSISEGMGSVDLCVEIQGPRILRTIVQPFSLVLNTTEGTAGKKMVVNPLYFVHSLPPTSSFPSYPSN